MHTHIVCNKKPVSKLSVPKLVCTNSTLFDDEESSGDSSGRQSCFQQVFTSGAGLQLFAGCSDAWGNYNRLVFYYILSFCHYPQGIPGRGARGSLWFTGIARRTTANREQQRSSAKANTVGNLASNQNSRQRRASC